MNAVNDATPAQPNLAIRAKPPSPKRLSRKVLLGATVFASAVITLALVSGLSSRPYRREADQQAIAASGGPPETIALASSHYDAHDLSRRGLAPAEDADIQTAELAPPQDPLWTNAPQAHGETTSEARAGPGRAAQDPEATAHRAPIMFAAISASNAQTVDDHDDVGVNLDARLRPPRSPYEIQAGNVIAAALVTGLNSDLAGRVIAQVTAPVYDSVSGVYLLIPQGARLIGAYDNGVRYGDRRILLVWNPLILPNGWSINLRDMNATDPSGASGLSDRTNNHLGRLSGAIALSAIISVIANNSENDDRDKGSLAQSVGDAAAQQAAQTGSQVVQRELSVHPTLSIRAGASVRVLVMRDIVLRPYPGAFDEAE